MASTLQELEKPIWIYPTLLTDAEFQVSRVSIDTRSKFHVYLYTRETWNYASVSNVAIHESIQKN